MICTDGFLEAGLYGCDHKLVMHSIFDELYDGSYKPSLVYNTENDGVHEHDRFREATQSHLQIGVQMSTLNHSGYRDIDKSVEGLLLLLINGVSRQLYGVHKSLFDGGCHRVPKMISDLASYSYVDDVTKRGLVDIY